MADVLVDVIDPAGRGAAAPRLRRTRALEHYLVAGVASLFIAITFGGFAKSYYLRGLIAAPLPSWVVHVHGLLMTAWVALFVVQAALIPAKRIRLHQRLGYSSIGLAVVIGFFGMWTALRAAQRGSPVPTDFPEPAFSIVPLGDIVLFALFFGGAIYFRKNAATHKRLMLLTLLNFLPPGLGRLPLASVQAAPVAWLLGVVGGVSLVCVAFDRWRYGRVNRVFVGGVVLLLASFPIRIAIMRTQAWLSIATWLASLA